jgi:HlyD family secretion protein
MAPAGHTDPPTSPPDSETASPSDGVTPPPSQSASTRPTDSPSSRPSSARPSAGTGGRQCPGGTGNGTGSGSTKSAGTGSGGTGPGAGGTGSGAGGAGNRGGGGDPISSAQTQLNNAQLSLEQAQLRLAGTVLTAPIGGRVLTVGGTVGSQERPGGTGFIVLGDLQDTEVQAQFSEADVASLAVGQPATITLPDQTAPVTGKVSQISPAGTVSGRLVRYGVLIAFDQAPADLLLGQSANVAVTTAQASGVLYVPSSAVTGIDGDTATVKVRSGRHDEPRTVTVGLRGDQYTEIKSGISEGEQVVL